MLDAMKYSISHTSSKFVEGNSLESSLPNIVGAIDGTLVPIVAPSDHEEAFDYLDIFNNDGLILLGDSGYALKRYLLKPIPVPRNEQEHLSVVFYHLNHRNVPACSRLYLEEDHDLEAGAPDNNVAVLQSAIKVF
ncbi:hypothetical protein DPMN_163269 [Dreissena polymorpha]|uniref:DDE Tnp4 domain-containing protein n=1 Tax=Dreissena polymorpha TaxID=45954 RepID=A0A9D4EQV8_DREPO|nr:hypothetical protein DPMN_163269 [Dreissena polymorpha]